MKMTTKRNKNDKLITLFQAGVILRFNHLT